MRPGKETQKCLKRLTSSLVLIPEAVELEETETFSDTEFIRDYTTHLKLLITAPGSRNRRSFSCLGDDMEEARTLIVEDKTPVLSKWKSCLDYVIYEKSKSSTPGGIMMNLKLIPNRVLWVRDGQNRYLGSIQVDSDTQNLTIYDSTGRPIVLIDTEDPRKKNSNDSNLSEESNSDLVSYRCSKSGLVLATCRLFRLDLKPQSKPAKVITLDFRAKEILELIDQNGIKRRLCLASMVLLESALKRRKCHGSKWYI